MPQYAAIIYSTDSDWTAPEHADEMAEYGAFSEAAAAIIRGGAALFPTSTATTVRTDRKGGDVVVSDGPYAETKEVLTGFFLLECDDLDHAIAVAATIPGAWNGAVEVRPVIPREMD
ncbi:YciI family protein [Nocardioides KLBMP 9356]|uniref:YciI family protein n=1 Tax=Nocardioides potassii TaxID=2911371 RepID=A0ABS9HCS6_9ACTN|nr:YciI family protein [Nocardioides potassii]MCF6377916.1 YciI family protein [Nocardioides potassii]